VRRPETPAREAAALLYARLHRGAGGRQRTQAHRHGHEADLIRGRNPPDGWAVDDYTNPAVEAVLTTEPAAMQPADDRADVVALMLDAGITAGGTCCAPWRDTS
jgi:hypothetical protein